MPTATDAKTEHPLNRHLFIADNLDLLRKLDNESVDLICIDPPFKKRKTFVGSLKPPLSDAELRKELQTLTGWGIATPQQALEAGINWPTNAGEARFKDAWSYRDDVHEDWVKRIENRHEGLHRVIEAARVTTRSDTAAYLCYMAVRLIEMHRVLKPTGSLYLHCDGDANSYLRLALDAIFGDYNRRNEIIWCYTGPSNTKRWFPRKHDTILFYAKSSSATFNRDAVRIGYKQLNIQHQQEGGGGIGGNLTPDNVDNYREKGKVPEDYWLEDRDGMSPVARLAGERTGYPTQKPVSLAERIIKASSNPGDVVLDCFAGCAYVPVAAERNKRQWIACDISPRALTVLRRQFARFRYAVDGEQQAEQPALLTDANVVTAGPYNLPERADEDPEPRVDMRKPEPEAYKTPASIIPEPEMLQMLLELSGYKAWCCGFANRRPDGSIIETTRNFHLDHLNPKSKEGTSNQITNRAPMCPTHNIRKNNRRVHLVEYRLEIADNEEMMVDSISDLINLTRAGDQALEIYAREHARRRTQPVADYVNSAG